MANAPFWPIRRQTVAGQFARGCPMREPDVMLTDYGLALECVFLAMFLGRLPTGRNGLGRAGIWFFVFLGLSAATGGTVHGFCPDQNSPVCRFLWQVTLQAIGLSAFSTWILGAGVLATGRTRRWLTIAAFPQIAFYTRQRTSDHAGVLDCIHDLFSRRAPVACRLLPRRLARRAPLASGRSFGLGIVLSIFLPPVHENWH